MAEQVEPSETRPEQPAEVPPEQSAETSLAQPAEAVAEKSAEAPAEKAAEAPEERLAKPRAAEPRKEEVPPTKMRPMRPAKAQATKTSFVKPAKAPREKMSEGARDPVRWRDVGTVINLLIFIANCVLVYPAWRAANAEADQATAAEEQVRFAKQEAAEAQQATAELRSELSSLREQVELIRISLGLPSDPAPPPLPGPADLALVPGSFTCSVRDEGEEKTLLNAEICYRLRFRVQNNGAVNRRVRVRAVFTREDSSWTCSSEERTVAFERSEQLLIPLINCFDEIGQRRNGDIKFSLQIEGPVE